MVKVSIGGAVRTIQCTAITTWLELVRRIGALLGTPPDAAGAGVALMDMTVDDVCCFFQGHGLGMYVAVVQREHIDGEVLRDLTEDGCKELGVKELHRKKMLRLIAARAGAERS